MIKTIKTTLIYRGCIIIGLLFICFLITYSEYSSEKTAVRIFNEQQLDTLSKEDARYWVNWSSNKSTIKWYLHRMIDNGSAPDSVYFWKQSEYIK